MAIKLVNKGHRTIEHAGNLFKPGMTASFTEATANRLLALYKGEVFESTNEEQDFSGGEESSTPDFSDMKVAELKAYLDGVGVEYTADDRKDDLIILAQEYVDSQQ